jgi:hypothetical protein
MEIIARCGYRCDLCPAFISNTKSFGDKKITSEKWEQYFGFYFPPEKINCPGCIGDNLTLDAGCPVKPCVIEKGLTNCAFCADFGCDKLKTRMDALGETLNKLDEIPEDDYQKYIRPYESRKRLTKIIMDLGNT